MKSKTMTISELAKITSDVSIAKWHTGLTGKMSWSIIGQMSRQTAHRGLLAEERAAKAALIAAKGAI